MDEKYYLKLVRNAICNVHNHTKAPAPRWALVSKMLACGSSKAAILCRMFDKDPDEIIQPVCDKCELMEEYVEGER